MKEADSEGINQIKNNKENESGQKHGWINNK